MRNLSVDVGSVYDNLHALKYRGPLESHREACNRQAAALQDDQEHFKQYRDLLIPGNYLPGGRIQSSVGSTRITTAYNCYVSGTFLDSFVHDEMGPNGHRMKGCIMDRAKEAAATMRLGGGIGYDFSPLRPNGALIKQLQSQTSGPLAFMRIFDAVCACVSSAGHRRGAQMGVLRIDHPDIERFIHAKQDRVSLTRFNLSTAITDKFMEALKVDGMFDLVFKGEVHRTIKANDLWNMLMRSTWDWAEPGSLFIDTINKWNNLYWLEYIAATNPCGEQPLPPFGACLLGSFNLVQYLKWTGTKYEFDWDYFGGSVAPVIRAMDNVIDRTIYPLKEQEYEAKAKRRMGVGVTALANTLEAMGFPYGSDGFVDYEGRILELLRDKAYDTSADLAQEKGEFPLFDSDKYGDALFIKTLPEQLQEKVRKGMRNSHLLSIAPTGTISFTAGNVSSGIEPVYDYEYKRNVETFDGKQEYTLSDFAYREMGIKGRTVKNGDITIDEHLAVLATAQKYVDSAVSKTINIPPGYSWDDFKQVYVKAYDLNCKGCTTYRTDGERESIFSEIGDDATATKQEAEEYAACYQDPVTGKKECE
jgi:ribonucleoside-diphosphate reductase alpha chain